MYSFGECVEYQTDLETIMSGLLYDNGDCQLNNVVDDSLCFEKTDLDDRFLTIQSYPFVPYTCWPGYDGTTHSTPIAILPDTGSSEQIEFVLARSSFHSFSESEALRLRACDLNRGLPTSSQLRIVVNNTGCAVSQPLVISDSGSHCSSSIMNFNYAKVVAACDHDSLYSICDAAATTTISKDNCMIFSVYFACDPLLKEMSSTSMPDSFSKWPKRNKSKLPFKIPASRVSEFYDILTRPNNHLMPECSRALYNTLAPLITASFQTLDGAPKLKCKAGPFDITDEEASFTPLLAFINKNAYYRFCIEKGCLFVPFGISVNDTILWHCKSRDVVLREFMIPTNVSVTM